MSERLIILLAVVFAASLLSVAARAHLRRTRQIERIEPGDLDENSQVVVFTSPYCHGCKQWLDALEEDSIDTQAIDISRRPDAAARYRISSTPRVAVVDRAGAVLGEFTHHAPRRSYLDAIGRLVAAR